MDRTVQKNMEIHQLQFIDKVIDVPVVLVVRIPQLQVVKETVDIPQLQLVEKIVVTPKGLITDLITQLQTESSSETAVKSYCDEEMDKSAVKKEDIGAEVAKHSCSVEAAVSTSSVSDSEVAEFKVDFGTCFAQQLSMDMRRDDELKIFTTDQEDLDLDEIPIVENTQVTDFSEHEHDVRSKWQRHSSMHQPMQEKNKEQKGTKEVRRNEREERRKSEREMVPGKESEQVDEDATGLVEVRRRTRRRTGKKGTTMKTGRVASRFRSSSRWMGAEQSRWDPPFTRQRLAGRPIPHSQHFTQRARTKARQKEEQSM